MRNHKTIGALCWQLVRAYTSAGCNLYPVTLTFKPFDDSRGCVREQLRVEVALFVHQLPKVCQQFGLSMSTEVRDLLALGFMQYPFCMETTLPRSFTCPNCTLIFCMPEPEKEGERFDIFVHRYKIELLESSRSILDLSAGPALEEDVDVELALYDPIVNGSVSASDLVMASQYSIYKWNLGKVPARD